MKKAKNREVFAETAVFWDIKRYPVPLGFDARQVRPRIKQVLEKYGYRGPLTIFAVGVLTNVHEDILRDLISSGIHLRYAPFGCASLKSHMYQWIRRNPPPKNIVALCDPLSFPRAKIGYNLFSRIRYSSRRKNPVSWISILTWAPREEYTSSTERDEPASWACSICNHLCRGQGLDSFASHLSSEEHLKAKLAYSPFQPPSKSQDVSRQEDRNPPTYAYFLANNLI